MLVNSSLQIKDTANFTYSCGFSLFLEDFLHLHSQIFDQLHSIYFFHFDCLYKLFMFLKRKHKICLWSMEKPHCLQGKWANKDPHNGKQIHKWIFSFYIIISCQIWADKLQTCWSPMNITKRPIITPRVIDHFYLVCHWLHMLPLSLWLAVRGHFWVVGMGVCVCGGGDLKAVCMVRA